MPRGEQLALWANLPRIQAQDALRHERYEPLDYQGIYQLVLQAYGNERRAQKAQSESLKAYVRHETEKARLQRNQ